MIPNKWKTLHRPRALCPIGSAARSIQSSWQTFGVVVLFLLLTATTLMLAHFFDVRHHRDQLEKRFPYATTHLLPAIPRRIVEDRTVVRHSSGLLAVRDIVAFPDELMLMIAAVEGSHRPSRHDLQCVFGQKYKTAVVTSEWKDDPRSILAVRCQYPPQFLRESKQATVLLKNSNFIVPSTSRYLTNSSWKPLVYETVTLTDSVLLFVKGLLDSRGRPYSYSKCLNKLSCRFGSFTNTGVIGVDQEVVRCELPSKNHIQQLQGALISLAVPNIGVLPSVAYFEYPRYKNSTKPTKKLFHMCSCTMLWNEAQFLQEWIMYHGFLGIERWFLYDNNSEDDIGEVLEDLQALKYNVTRHVWPWLKTQEAAFSHCALRARADCEWVLFTDVDEFVYPGKELDLISRAQSPSSIWQQATNSRQGPGDSLKQSSETILGRVIQETLKRGEALGKKVGEVRLQCHNFGPSRRLHAPEEGVMVGYTCRMRWPKRHKSFILLEAMSDGLQNVVHHFALREGYEEMPVHVRIAVINHYKFQAWEVFTAKFVRRAATYVVDWRDQTAQSNDRAPGLGIEAVEPPDWPARYCEEKDLGLRNFTWNFFRHPQTQHLPWQATERVKGTHTSLETY